MTSFGVDMRYHQPSHYCSVPFRENQKQQRYLQTWLKKSNTDFASETWDLRKGFFHIQLCEHNSRNFSVSAPRLVMLSPST